MNKQGQQTLLTIIALGCLILLAIIVFFASEFIPGKGTTQGMQTITSQTEQADKYLLTVNLATFTKSSYQGTEIYDLITAAHSKDESAKQKLLEAAKEYLKMYENRCVTIELVEKKENLFWQNEPISKGCLKTGTLALLKPKYNIEIKIPTDDYADIKIVQKST